MTETRYYEPTRLSTQPKPLFHSFTKNLFLVKPLDATAWLRSLLSKVSPVEATMLKWENDIAMQSFCYRVMERFHSRGRHLCKFTGTKQSVCIRKEVNSHHRSQRTTLEHQRGLEWPPFHCFGTPIWPQWRYVKTLYIRHPGQSQWTAFRFWRIIFSKRCNLFGRFSVLALTKSRDRNSETSEWFRIGIHRRPAYFDPLRSVSSDALIWSSWGTNRKLGGLWVSAPFRQVSEAVVRERARSFPSSRVSFRVLLTRDFSKYRACSQARNELAGSCFYGKYNCPKFLLHVATISQWKLSKRFS